LVDHARIVAMISPETRADYPTRTPLDRNTYSSILYWTPTGASPL
jgi:hypothetical protein